MTHHTRHHSFALKLGAAFAAALTACLLPTGCGKSGRVGNGDAVAKVSIQNKGSDTMVNLAQVWAEEYRKVAPNVEVEVSGGGSGQGIAALLKGTIDIANCSRNMKPEEIEQAVKEHGQDTQGIHRRLRRAGGLRAQGQSARRNHL